MTSMIFFNYAVDSTKACAVPFRSVRDKIRVGSKHVDSTSLLLSASEWNLYEISFLHKFKLKLAPASVSIFLYISCYVPMFRYPITWECLAISYCIPEQISVKYTFDRNLITALI